ncbi:MAG TPA: hypothetical protein VM532_16155 [Burkholderiales bacterium]|nr:hypothetical protein [Burkholderiales bacterium]
MGAVNGSHRRLLGAQLAPSFRRSPESQQAPILVTETPETTLPLSPSNAAIPTVTSPGALQPDRHHLISDLALQHAIKHCLEDMSGLATKADLGSDLSIAMTEQLNALLQDANGVQASDSESLKKLRTSVLSFFASSFAPHIMQGNQNALPSIDHLPERLVETVGALLASHQFEGMRTSGEKTQLLQETSANTRLTDLNRLLSAYSARLNQYAHVDSMTSAVTPCPVHIRWGGKQGVKDEIKMIVLATSGGLAEQEAAHKAARDMGPNSPTQIRVAPICNAPFDFENRPSLRSSADRKQGIEESDATHKLLAYIEDELLKNHVAPGDAKGYVNAPLGLPVSITEAALIANFTQRWPKIEVCLAPQKNILHEREVKALDPETELTRHGKPQVFAMPSGNFCTSALHLLNVIQRRDITEQAKQELADSLSITKDKIKFQPLNEKLILSNEVTVEKVKGDYAFIPVPGQRQGGERVYIKATFAELGLRTITEGQKISLDRTRRPSRSRSPSGAGNPPPPSGQSR